MSTWIIFAFGIPGVIVLLLGRYINKTGYVEVLKQYDDKKTYNKDGLKNFLYKLMSATGLLTLVGSLIFGILQIITKNDTIGLYFLGYYIIVTLHYVLQLRFCCKRYEIKG